MPRLPCEIALGVVNGVNRDFSVGFDYVPGTTAVFLNGLALRKDWDDGWEELGKKKFRMKIPPLDGDVVQVFYVVL